MRKPTLRNYTGLVLLAVVLIMSGCATCKTTSAIGPRPSTWAAPMKDNCNVPNLYKINNNLYRSGEPTEIGITSLCEQLRIKTITNLEEFHNDTPSAACPQLHMERVPMNAGENNPEVIDKAVIKVMKILSNPKNGPFLIHCKYGSDRTGLMCAMYRIIYQKWTRDKAIDEMVNGRYGFHTAWYGNIIEYIQKADIEKLQKQIHAK